MSVQITITGANADETLQDLAALAKAMVASQPVHVTNVTNVTAAAPQQETTGKPPRKPRNTKPQDEPENKPAPTADSDPEQNETPPPEDDHVGESEGSGDEGGGDQDDAPIPDIIKLRALATEKGKASPEGKKAVRALIEEFGCKSLSDIPENMRAAFKVRLEEL